MANARIRSGHAGKLGGLNCIPCMLQGERCARHPWRVLGCALLVILLCCVGWARFRVETDPQRLWVGPGSQAAREKAAYEVPCLGALNAC